MCIKVRGEGKWCGKEEGRAGAGADRSQSFCVNSEPKQYLQACAGLEAREDGSPRLGKRKGLRLAQQRL